MRIEPIVYLGPSLPRTEAENIAAADYRPPVRRGDLAACVTADTVVIIDGEFNQNLSVSPKEILALLDQGVRVIGAASMGALRAVELRPYGMIGRGWVFEAYSSTRILGDDEVAVTYSPFDMHPLTVPLVNVRFWLYQLRARGKLDPPIANRFLRRARKIFFGERTLDRLREIATILAPGVVREVQMLEAYRECDVKAADARRVLAELSWAMAQIGGDHSWQKKAVRRKRLAPNQRKRLAPRAHRAEA